MPRVIVMMVLIAIGCQGCVIDFYGEDCHSANLLCKPEKGNCRPVNNTMPHCPRYDGDCTDPAKCQCGTMGGGCLFSRCHCDTCGDEINMTCGSVRNTTSPGKWMRVKSSKFLRVLHCPDEHFIEGSPIVVICLTNGSWTFTSAECKIRAVSVGQGAWIFNILGAIAIAAVSFAVGCCSSSVRRRCRERRCRTQARQEEEITQL